MAASSDSDKKAFVEQYLSRRRLLGGAVASGAALSLGFFKTKEIAAQQLTGTSLYDQLGGLAGITAVIKSFLANVVADDRINSFFAGTVANNRAARLQELLIQQVAQATGGPVTYTGLDMKSAHAGLGITSAAFMALVEDLALALDQNGVATGPKTMLLNALAPLKSDIVEIP